MTWKPPQAFEEYKLIELLGRGGMGAVYLARDTILDRAVAIKFIAVDADQQARDRFVIEARAIARVQHPNVVAIYRVGEVEGRPFIVSELVRGKRLDLLAGSLSSEGLVDIAIQLCRGLAAAHRRGVLHRDLKPENAILAEGGEVKLLDFGIAKLTGEPERLSKASGFLAWNESTAILDGVPPGAPPSPASPARPANRTAPDLASATLPAGEKAAADLDVTASIPSLAAVAGTSFRPGERAGDDRPPEDWWAGAASSPSPSPTHDGAVMGTPFYIAPEVWGGAPASPRADVYSLGATLFMLAAGRPPHQGDSIYAIADKACRQDAPPVADAAPFLSDPVAAIIDRCLVRDPGGRFADGDAVREAFETLTAVRAQDKLPAGNPYRGLAAFEAAHQGLFFGRGREVRAVIERVRSGPWVLVAGDSGVGKSSLLRAGVLPAIAQGSLGDGRDYLTMTMMPSHAPWTTFIARLGATLGLDDLEADDDPMPIARSLARRLGDDLGVMVLIDQLEELVTLSDPEESALLAQALILLGQTVPGLHVACTVRADFLTRVSALPGIGETMDSALYLLRPMDEDGVREAIVGPARALGVSFESADIVDELAAAVAGAGGLPLLQFCLAELWQRHDRDAKQITRQSLDDLGGVDGALSNHADAVIADLRPGQKQAARTLLVKLVATSGTRERLSETELCGASDDARAALNA
ncbi:MAG TPA: serine/threonine-protein kinase, partial [Kofleriaceae bacterium]|nr:serine/threonine-protein kinase [Kofleriaceae bacterium]